MSVQIKRRREAAAFLSTYVGAQGELLIDTTNNRVQVHDGVAPGGWPAAGIGDLPGRNAAINGNFAINQRGYASGTSLAASAYAHDRWKAGAGGCSYTFAQAASDTMITITAGTIIQAIDAPNVYATAWWLTWMGTATARVWQGSASGTFSSGVTMVVAGVTVNALLVAGLTIGTIVNVELAAGSAGTGTFGLMQFEAALPNAGPTRFERRHGELARCQRYFYQAVGGPAYIFYIGAYCLQGQNVSTLIGFPSSMRATPTMSFVGTYASANVSNPIIASSSAFGAVGFVSAQSTGNVLFYNNNSSGFAANAEI